MSDLVVVEHGETSRDRFLRRERLRIALVAAVVEGILVLAGVVPWWLVFVLAAAGLTAYLALGRESRHDTVRHLTWIAAVSQLLVALVPVFAAVLTALAVVVLVVAAAVALAALILDRR